MSRRHTREEALQVLCLLDTQPDLSPEEGLRRYREVLRIAQAQEDDDDQPLKVTEADHEALLTNLVRGVREDRTTLDQLISHSSKNWRLERMNWVDRNVLRMAAYELRSCIDIPGRVAINEAIELAKKYGTNESSAFVNGVLDRLMNDLGRR